MAPMKTTSIMALAALTVFSFLPTASAKLELATKDGKYKAAFNGRIQERFTFEKPGAEDAPSEFNFGLPRARFGVAGTAFTEGLSYKFQLDFGKGSAKVIDFYVQYMMNDMFGVRLGQGKMPFSRQQLTSSGKQAFVDRAFVDKRFGTGRDIGVTLLSNYKKSRIEWALGIFNGTGIGTIPEQFAPAIVARFGYHSANMTDGYSEADLAPDRGFRWAVAASTRIDLDVESAEARDESVEAGADFIVKASGFSLNGGFLMGLNGPTIGDLDNLGLGAHAQAGYTIDRTYMPAVRFATHMPDGDDNDIIELQAAFSVFVFGSHNLKWQTDFTVVMPEAGDNDYVVRSQIQLAY